MKIGKYEVREINLPEFKLDGGAMFGVVPKVMWNKTNPSDDKNRVNLAARCLLLSSGNRNILIDCGTGAKYSEKQRDIYDLPETDTIDSELNKYNLTTNDITDVIFTHLHFDHCGGSTHFENDKLKPTFTNAKHYVQKENYNWAINPSDRDRASYMKESFLPLYQNGMLNLINEDYQWDDEISLIKVEGHTFGQQCIKISDSSNTLFYLADLIPFAAHVHIPFIMGFDLQPLITIEEKKKYLKQAVDENWLLFLEHDPDFALMNIEYSNNKFTAKNKKNGIDKTA